MHAMMGIIYAAFFLATSVNCYKLSGYIMGNTDMAEELATVVVRGTNKSDNFNVTVNGASQTLDSRLDLNKSAAIFNVPSDTKFTLHDPKKESRNMLKYNKVNVIAHNGQVVIGSITGGSFGTGSFTVNKTNCNNTTWFSKPCRNSNITQNELAAYSSTKQPFPGSAYNDLNGTINFSNSADKLNTTQAQNGQIVVGVTGGSFGNGSFTINETGRNETNRQDEKIIHDARNKGNENEHKTKYGLGTEYDDRSRPPILSATNDSFSVAIHKIEGGYYPSKSFSIGHGQDIIKNDSETRLNVKEESVA